MTEEASNVRVVVVANEKGGSGKSTIAVNVAIGLMRAGHTVATIDLDTQQRSLTHYIDNRLVWSREAALQLPTPSHHCFDEDGEFLTSSDEIAGREALAKLIESLAIDHNYIVIDTPGHMHYLARMAHSLAETLITPLNDSFVDLEALGSVDPNTNRVTVIGHYAGIVDEGRRTRIAGELDWIVLRNRLSPTKTRNRQMVGAALEELSQKLGFRIVEGLAERLIFREFYPRGLTAVDQLDKGVLGVRPTLSHLTAALEMQSLIHAVLRFPAAQADVPAQADAA